MDFNTLAFNFAEFIKKIPKPHGLEVSDWTVVVAGIGIVLSTLILLILVFYAFGSLVSKAEESSKKRAAKRLEKKKAKAAKKAASDSSHEDKAESLPVSVSAPVSAPAPVIEEGISGEVVAAISAAVYSMEGGNVKIAAIRKQNPITARNPWAQAAVIDNTRPF
ncbi:MAG: OadG family protein [Eubacterium sp.]